MVRAHRQAWTWQDEWYGLTMEDIRELERQTQLMLAKKMGAASGSVSGDEQEHSESSSPAVLTPSPPGQQADGAANEAPASARTPVSPGAAPSWPMACISESSSSEDDEFFDCQGVTSACLLTRKSPDFFRSPFSPFAGADCLPREQNGAPAAPYRRPWSAGARWSWSRRARTATRWSTLTRPTRKR